MLISMISIAYAMAPATGEGGQGSGYSALIPLVLMFAIFYFLLIRPQQSKSRKQRELLDGLKRDDMVVTTGGIHGKITGMTDTVITLEIAPNVRIKVSRSHIAGKSVAHTKPEDNNK